MTMKAKYRIYPYIEEEKGKLVKRYKIMSRNGKEVAKCNTINFAQRCCAALEAFDDGRNLRLVGGMRAY